MTILIDECLNACINQNLKIHTQTMNCEIIIINEGMKDIPSVYSSIQYPCVDFGL